MGIPVKTGRQSAVPMPAGINQAVVVEVGPLEKRENKFEPNKPPQMQAPVTFRNAAGQEARTWYTPSFHERAKLAKDLKGVRGGTLPDASTFDLQAAWPNGLLGMQCQLLIAPHERNARGYVNAKIQAVMPPAPGQNIPVNTPPLLPTTNVPPANAAPGTYPVPPATPAPAPQQSAVPTTSNVGF